MVDVKGFAHTGCMLIYTHSDCLRHENHPGHPERPDRLRAVLAHLEQTGMLAQTQLLEAPLVDTTALGLVHTPAHLQQLRASLPAEGLVSLDADTTLCPHSLDAAHRAAGAVLDATRAVLNGEARRAFCAVRPPGHHAESATPMGFCFYNSVAVAAAWALTQPGIERVAILDFDVHHGNGTVEIFADDPRVMVCSSFQFPFYPGRFDDVVRDHIVLTPLSDGCNGDDFRAAIARDWFDRLEAHRPQLIIVSAGFDAHHADPLAGLKLTEADFGWITREIVALSADSAQGRVVSALEGGYDLAALASSTQAHLEALID